MNWKYVAIVLLAILLGTGPTAAFFYIQNQQLNLKITRIEDDLTFERERVSYYEQQNQELQTKNQELLDKITVQDDRISKLETKVNELEIELKRLTYVTVALTFLWNNNTQVDTVQLDRIVERLNTVIWDKFHIYFFIYREGVSSFISQDEPLGNCFRPGWCDRALNLYPVRDIPIAIFMNINDPTAAAHAISYDGKSAISVRFQYLFYSVIQGSQILSHEILHVFGITDKRINLEMGAYSDNIPFEWTTRLQTSAKTYETEYSFS